jgi:glycine betaine transporter
MLGKDYQAEGKRRRKINSSEIKAEIREEMYQEMKEEVIDEMKVEMKEEVIEEIKEELKDDLIEELDNVQATKRRE